MTGFFRGPITGPKFFAIFASFFIVIIAVNIVMATSAIETFPGLVVKNSYVASQSFDRDRAAQEALGWSVDATVDGDHIEIAITNANGAAVEPATVAATFGRPTTTRDDQELELTFDGSVFRGPIDYEPGQWRLWITATADNGTEFKQELQVHIRG